MKDKTLFTNNHTLLNRKAENICNFYVKSNLHKHTILFQ